MDAFFANIFSFPTIVFTLLLGVICVYWLFAIIGMVDIDILDLDIDLDADSDFDLEGFAGLMVTLGLSGVPLTVVITVLTLSAWVISFLVVHFFFFWGDNTLLNTLIGLAVVLGAVAVSIPVTATLIKPLRPVFRALNSPASKKVFVGRSCTVKSTRVDEGFGEANIAIDGADIIIRIRSKPEHGLKRGDKALIVEKIDGSTAYWVEPEN